MTGPCTARVASDWSEFPARTLSLGKFEFSLSSPLHTLKSSAILSLGLKPSHFHSNILTVLYPYKPVFGKRHHFRSFLLVFIAGFWCVVQCFFLTKQFSVCWDTVSGGGGKYSSFISAIWGRGDFSSLLRVLRKNDVIC